MLELLYQALNFFDQDFISTVVWSLVSLWGSRALFRFTLESCPVEVDRSLGFDPGLSFAAFRTVWILSAASFFLFDSLFNSVSYLS